MKTRILKTAHQDLPLYFEDFQIFWNDSLNNMGEDDLFELYKATLLFKNWKISLQALDLKNFDILVNEIYEDVNSSFYLALLGQYRSAYMHLRSTIELSLLLLYFIHHPIEYMKWKGGSFVIKQDKLTDYLLSHPYFDTIDIESHMKKITKKWRFFSKHIHGESPSFFQSDRESKKNNSFNIADFGKWKTAYLSNINNINKLFVFFFRTDIRRFPTASREIILSTLNDDELSKLLGQDTLS